MPSIIINPNAVQVMALTDAVTANKSIFINNYSELVVVASASGEQSINLSGTVSNISVYINGLKQGSGNYTYASNVLTLPSPLNIIAGDTITVYYIII
jgi:hypothetical protein